MDESQLPKLHLHYQINDDNRSTDISSGLGMRLQQQDCGAAKFGRTFRKYAG